VSFKINRINLRNKWALPKLFQQFVLNYKYYCRIIAIYTLSTKLMTELHIKPRFAPVEAWR
jgi:hypothetical protein